MKKAFGLLLLSFCLTSVNLRAGGFDSSAAKDNAGTEAHGGIPFEFDAEYSYIGGEGQVSRGRDPLRRDIDLDEDYTYLRFIYTPRVKFGILRLGAVYERFGFGAPVSSEVPRGLQSLSAVVGLDTQFSDSILVRVEATPGFYSARHLDGDDFNVPFVIGGTYIWNANIQFVLGVSVDFERDYPVFPGGGVRWRLASQWVLNAVLPTPRLEYELNKDCTIYLGGDIKGSSFRVDDEFGSDRGIPRLNHAILTYTEIRAGLGVEWKLSPEIKLSLEGGYLPYREFDYHRAEVRYHHEEGAPYGSLALRAAF